MSYELTIRRSEVERLKEEAWKVTGIPKRVITDRELADLLKVSPDTIARAKRGEKVAARMVAGIMWVFRNHPEVIEGLWTITSHEATSKAA